MIITEIDPGKRSYKIIRCPLRYFYCYPDTEVEKMELLYCFSGNYLSGDLIVLPIYNLTYLPDNLTVRGSIDIEYLPISRLPKNLRVGMHLLIRGTRIPEDYDFPDELKLRVWR